MARQFKKLAHSLYECKYHVVFCPKYRDKILETEVAQYVTQKLYDLCRQKEGVETCFHVLKSDLKISPLFLHKDARISAMLFINMVALLAYNMLQHQVHQQALLLTTRQIIKHLDNLVIVETLYVDGSCSRRMTDVKPELLTTLSCIAHALSAMVQRHSLLLSAPTHIRLVDTLADPLLLAAAPP